MRQYRAVITAAVIALCVAGGLAMRITLKKAAFDKTVKDALKTSEGYDQRFIDMVNKLEYELALRASFGYKGQKDPMTGKERIVVRHPVRKKKGKQQVVPEPAGDPVKLTAIIFDDESGLYTAIIMYGERSFAIEVGDFIVGRKISAITNDRVVMEDDSYYYWYEITGSKGKRSR